MGDTHSIWSQLLPESVQSAAGGGGNWDPPKISEFRKEMDAIIFPVKDILPKCEFEGKAISCKDYTRTFLDKDHDLCYKIKLDKLQKSPGIGLRFLLDLNVDATKDHPAPFEGAYIGVGKTIDPFESPQMVVSPGSYVKINLEVQHEKLISVSYSETPQSCLEDFEGFKVLRGKYSENFCLGDCVQDAIFRHCGCFMLLDADFIQEKYHDKLYCTDQEIEDCAGKITKTSGTEIRECSRKCVTPCTSWKFSAEQSSMRLGSSRSVQLFQQGLTTTLPPFITTDSPGTTEFPTTQNRSAQDSESASPTTEIPQTDSTTFQGSTFAAGATVVPTTQNASTTENADTKTTNTVSNTTKMPENQSTTSVFQGSEPQTTFSQEPEIEDPFDPQEIPKFPDIQPGYFASQIIQDIEKIDKLQNPLYWQKSVVLIDISFHRNQYKSITQSPAKTNAQMISDVGGTAGLWLGCSIFTFVQLVTLLIGVVYSKFK